MHTSHTALATKGHRPAPARFPAWVNTGTETPAKGAFMPEHSPHDAKPATTSHAPTRALTEKAFVAPALRALRAEIMGRLDALLAHNGHGDLCISVRWAKRGTREVIVSGGPQERFLLREKSPTESGDS